MCENVAVNLNRMLRVTKILLPKIQSARKILLSGNQPLDRFEKKLRATWLED